MHCCSSITLISPHPNTLFSWKLRKLFQHFDLICDSIRSFPPYLHCLSGSMFTYYFMFRYHSNMFTYCSSFNITKRWDLRIEHRLKGNNRMSVRFNGYIIVKECVRLWTLFLNIICARTLQYFCRVLLQVPVKLATHAFEERNDVFHGGKNRIYIFLPLYHFCSAYFRRVIFHFCLQLHRKTQEGFLQYVCNAL